MHLCISTPPTATPAVCVLDMHGKFPKSSSAVLIQDTNNDAVLDMHKAHLPYVEVRLSSRRSLPLSVEVRLSNPRLPCDLVFCRAESWKVALQRGGRLLAVLETCTSTRRCFPHDLESRTRTRGCVTASVPHLSLPASRPTPSASRPTAARLTPSTLCHPPHGTVCCRNGCD